MSKFLGGMRKLFPLLVVLCPTGLAMAANSQHDASRPAPERGVVNINDATIEQLRLLPGIGPAKARRIIARRERRTFRTVYELRRVRGIAGRTYRRLRPYVAVKGPTTLRVKVRRKR